MLCGPRLFCEGIAAERLGEVMLFIPMLRSIVREQALRIVDHKGRSHLVGDGTTPAATIRLRSKRLEYVLALNPALALGEAYMDGLLVVEDGKLYDFLEVLARNYGKLGTNPWLSLIERLGRGLKQANSFTRARRNIAHHYDFSDQLYDIFLDRERAVFLRLLSRLRCQPGDGAAEQATWRPSCC
jgi:cyclopropane-fatty-acyl-phospholipid synthase